MKNTSEADPEKATNNDAASRKVYLVRCHSRDVCFYHYHAELSTSLILSFVGPKLPTHVALMQVVLPRYCDR
jgi:hypothetical protein